MNLSWLFAPIQKHAPEVVTPFFADYIHRSTIPGDTTYNYGYGSLKWVIFRINETEPDKVSSILFNIICETIARNIDPETIQFSCHRLFCLHKYKPMLKEVDSIDLETLPVIKIGPLKAVINQTGRNITALIFRKMPDIAIVIATPIAIRTVIASGSEATSQLKQQLNGGSSPFLKGGQGGFASISFPANIDLSEIKDYLLDELGQVEGGWTVLTTANGPTTFINHAPQIKGYQHIVQALTVIASRHCEE